MNIVPVVYVLSLGVLAFIHCRRLWSGCHKREALIYALSMALSAVVGVLLISGAGVPTLVLPYKIVFEPIGKMIMSP